MKLVLAAALVALSFPAFAQTAQQSQNEAYSGAQSNVYMSNPDKLNSRIKTNPGIGGPGLTTSNDTCAGSFGVGGSFVGFGAVVGKTYEMEHCVRTKETVLLAQLGNNRAAQARLCQGKKVAQAMWDAGTPCPQDRQRYQAAVSKVQPAAQAAQQVNSGRYSDLPKGTRYSRDGGRTWQVKR